MLKKKLSDMAELQVTDNHVCLTFETPLPTLSSAVVNGGFTAADHILNLKVPKKAESEETPDQTIHHYCQAQQWDGQCVGLMTAASMDSFRFEHESVQGVDIYVMVTTGLDNARRVGDTAEYRNIYTYPEERGTINIIIFTSACMTESAMVEALMLATEAKTTALHEAGIVSPISNQLATGTGTDSVVLVSNVGKKNVSYCGKHVVFGEVLGRLVYQAVASSIAWECKP